MINKDREIEKLKLQLEELRERLADSAYEESEEIAEKAREIMQTIKEKSKQLWEVTSEKKDSVRKYVQENPWKSVGISAATGFLIAMLFNKKNKNRD